MVTDLTFVNPGQPGKKRTPHVFPGVYLSKEKVTRKGIDSHWPFAPRLGAWIVVYKYLTNHLSLGLLDVYVPPHLGTWGKLESIPFSSCLHSSVTWS